MKTVIVGAGFGGLEVAKQLCGVKDHEVTLIDRNNHHLFQPLLYQLASAALSAADISAPVKNEFEGCSNVNFLLNELKSVDLVNRKVQLTNRALDYDRLVLACGSVTHYFGNDHWREHSYGLKSLQDARDIRNRVLINHELAQQFSGEEEQAYKTFVVVGGGPTGVEMAGSLIELGQMHKDLDDTTAQKGSMPTRVVLVEMGARLLPSFPESLSKQAEKDLQRMGVELCLGCTVTDIDSSGVELGGGGRLLSRCVIWAAGVGTPTINKLLDVKKSKRGQILVDDHLRVLDHPEVFCLGDQAHYEDEKGRVLPGLASVAKQQGRYLGRFIAGKTTKAFAYRDFGQMAAIGTSRAVIDFGKIQFKGRVGWLVWSVIHILLLVSFQNRLIVFLHWIWSYLTFQAGAKVVDVDIKLDEELAVRAKKFNPPEDEIKNINVTPTAESI